MRVGECRLLLPLPGTTATTVFLAFYLSFIPDFPVVVVVVVVVAIHSVRQESQPNRGAEQLPIHISDRVHCFSENPIHLKMAPNPLVVLCSAAVVLIALATVATSAPVEAKAEDRQQRQQLDASESRSAKPDEHQQQHHQQHQQHQRQQEKQQQHLQHQQQQQQQLQGIGPLVNSLLTSLLRQTLYTRMENLLLDGSSSSSQFPSEVSPLYPSHPESVRKSGERRRIVDSAVRNYQEQDGGLSQDFTKLAGK